MFLFVGNARGQAVGNKLSSPDKQKIYDKRVNNRGIAFLTPFEARKLISGVEPVKFWFELNTSEGSCLENSCCSKHLNKLSVFDGSSFAEVTLK